MAVDIRAQYEEAAASDYEGYQPTRVADSRLVPCGSQQIVLSTNLTPSSLSVPIGASIVLINVEAQPLRYSDSDQASSTFGILLPVGSTVWFTLANLRTISLCGTVAGSIANILYYRIPAGRQRVKAEAPTLNTSNSSPNEGDQ